MDFDHVSVVKRSLEGTPARRDILRAIASIGLGLGAMRLSDAAEAKSRHKKHSKKKHHKGTQSAGNSGDPQSPPPPPTCTPHCTGLTCGDDGCGGSCGTCAGPTCNGTTLTNNICLGGFCAPVQSFCGTGQRCFQNACCTPRPQPSCHKQPIADGCGGTYLPNCTKFCCDGANGDLVCQATACP